MSTQPQRPAPFAQLRNHPRTSEALTSLLICLLMVTLLIGFMQLGKRMFPEWSGGYYIAIAVLFSLEAIYTRRNTNGLEGREKIIFHLSEWVAFAVLIKLFIYTANGFQGFFSDLRAWQASFMNFFTMEYLIALTLGGMIWFSARSYANEMDDLFDREQDSGWDDLGKLQNALNTIRGRMINRVFFQGALLVIMAVFTRLEASELLRTVGITTPGYRAPVMNVLLYFMLALVLLSQTQFALLRTRWSWLRLPTSTAISGNWVKYSLIFFGVLSLVVFFLPTEYSLGLFDTLQGVGNLLTNIIMFLLMIITLPLTWCLSLFNFTEGRINGNGTPPLLNPPPVQPTPEAAPFPWLAFLRSLFFWAVFLTVIFLAISYYLRQNTTLLNSMRAFPLTQWLARLWRGLRNWFSGVNRQVGSLVKAGVDRIRLRRPTLTAPDIRRLFDARRLSPRDKIIFFFVSLTQVAGERGIDRQPNQTPHDYEVQLSQAVPDVEPDLHNLTEAFYEARYSQHPFEEPQAEQANSLWDHIKGVLRKWQKS